MQWPAQQNLLFKLISCYFFMKNIYSKWPNLLNKYMTSSVVVSCYVYGLFSGWVKYIIVAIITMYIAIAADDILCYIIVSHCAIVRYVSLTVIGKCIQVSAHVRRTFCIKCVCSARVSEWMKCTNALSSTCSLTVIWRKSFLLYPGASFYLWRWSYA